MGVQSYISAITNGRGMARSNLYAVYFTGGPITTAVPPGSQPLINSYGKIDVPYKGNNITQVGERILLMCDEVTLPGVQFATGSVSRYAGAAPVSYATNLIYNDLQLSFMCDAEMQAVKFLQDWHGKIYTYTGSGTTKSYRMNYPDEYKCILKIEKRERDEVSEVNRLSLRYTLHGAWPYSIDAIPLSYGSSQLVKVTANFYYTNYDIEKFALETI